MNISEHKKQITKQLSAISDSPQRDAELLIMHVTHKTRSQLLVNYDEELSKSIAKQLSELVKRRIKQEPIAYILGHQPFWTVDLIVTHDTLIPRPETECLIDWILATVHAPASIADLGTGTGAIAIALVHENAGISVDATDLSYEALAIAKKNIDKYNLKNIALYQGDWCDALPKKNYDVIVSNPPYIAEHDPHLKQLSYEPQSALISGKKGLTAIEKIISQSKKFLKENGFLIIEHGYDQGLQVAEIFKAAGFLDVMNHYDLSDKMRFVTGRMS